MAERNPFKKYHQRKRIKSFLKESLLVLPILFGVLLIVNGFFVSTITIKNDGMYPGLKEGRLYFVKKYPILFNKAQNLLLVNKHYDSIKRGDIVLVDVDVDSHKDSWFLQALNVPLRIVSFGLMDVTRGRFIVSRVLALPGNTVEIKNKRIIMDQVPYEPQWNIYYESNEILPETVSERDNREGVFVDFGHFFVLNDNWNRSNDSRTLSPIRFDQIVGIIR